MVVNHKNNKNRFINTIYVWSYSVKQMYNTKIDKNRIYSLQLFSSPFCGHSQAHVFIKQMDL